MEMEKIIFLLLWIIAIGLFIYGIFKKDQNPSMILGFIVFVFALARVAYLALSGAKPLTDIWSAVPLPIFALSLFYFIVFTVNYFKYDTFNQLDFSGLAIMVILIGIGNIIGASFFSYGYSQYIVGSILIVFGIAFWYLEKQISIKHQLVLSIILATITLLSYVILVEMFVDQISLKNVSDILVKNNHAILCCLLFFLIIFSRNQIIDEKHWGYLKNAFVSLAVAGLVLHHPELTGGEYKIADGIKKIIAFGDVGSIIYGSSVAIVSAKIHV